MSPDHDQAEDGHLPGCIPAAGGGPDCEGVRAVYGLCPDHDPLCVPGCPSQEGGPR